MLLDPECEGERPWREDELPVLVSLRGEVVSVLSVVVFDVVVFLCFLCFFLCAAVLFWLPVDELVPVAVSLVDEPLIEPLPVPVAVSLLPVPDPIPLEPVSVPDCVLVLDPVVAASSRSWSRSVELEPIDPVDPEALPEVSEPVDPEPIDPEPVLVLLLPVPALPPPPCAYAGLANSAAAAMMPMSFFMRERSFVGPTLAARCPQGGGEKFAPRNVGTRPALRYPA